MDSFKFNINSEKFTKVDDNRSVGIMFVAFFHQHLLEIYLNIREDWEREICFNEGQSVNYYVHLRVTFWIVLT